MIAWSFYQGFYPQESGGGTPAVPSMRLVCQHHSGKTRNYRGLEERVEHDEEGGVISQRKREKTATG
jgi:hypothetical protein